MKIIKKTLKWIMISIGSLVVIIIILAIVYNQITFALLAGVGSMDLYNGNNERGNKIINYAISKIDKPSGETYHAASVQNTKNGNYNIAIPALEKAIKLDPEEASAYYGWVLLYYYHDYEKALTILEQHDGYTPNFADAPMAEDIHYLKGLCYMQLGRYQKAVDEFDTYINNLIATHGEDFVNVYTFVQKGRCLTHLGQYEQAINSYTKAIKYYDNCTEAYYFMGVTQLQLNEKENACTSFNRALNLIQTGHKSSDTYVEFFHEIYEQQIEESLLKYCK